MANHETPLSRNEALLQNILGEVNELLEPMSNNEKILLNILGVEGVDIDPPQSRIEKLLLEVLEQGPSISVEPLTVTENGTVTAPSDKAYSPVTVNVTPKLQETVRAVSFSGSETVVIEPDEDYDGLSRVEVYIGASDEVYIKHSFMVSSVSNLPTIYTNLREIFNEYSGLFYGSMTVSVGGTAGTMPVRYQKLSDTISVAGGIVLNGEGIIVTLSIAEDSATCGTLYQIGNGAITDLTSMASALLRSFIFVVYSKSPIE